MEHVLYFFVGGMILWLVAFLLTPRMKKELDAIRNNKSLSTYSLLSLISLFSLFALILMLLFLGLLFNLSALLMFIIWLSTLMFSVFPEGLIQYKEFLSIFVQITSLFGTVSIAAAAYLFKKKS